MIYVCATKVQIQLLHFTFPLLLVRRYGTLRHGRGRDAVPDVRRSSRRQSDAGGSLESRPAAARAPVPAPLSSRYSAAR